MCGKRCSVAVLSCQCYKNDIHREGVVLRPHSGMPPDVRGCGGRNVSHSSPTFLLKLSLSSGAEEANRLGGRKRCLTRE